MEGSLIIVCIVFWLCWSDAYVIGLPFGEGHYSSYVLCFARIGATPASKNHARGRVTSHRMYRMLHALERHLHRRVALLGGSVFIVCVVFYMCWRDICVVQLPPWGGPLFIVWLVFDVYWWNIRVAELASWEGHYSTFALHFTRTGATSG